MAKKRKEHESCSNDDSKRSKLLEEEPDYQKGDAILYVPDTPQSQIKKKVRHNSNEFKTDKEDVILDELCESTDDFSDDEDISFDDSIVKDIENALTGFTKYTRYEILTIDVIENIKAVYCKDTSNEKVFTTLKLSGEWYHSNISPGSYIHVVCGLCNPVEIEISNASPNMIIIHPDILVSPTTISSSVRCPRQAVLGEVFKPTVGYSSNEIMLQGTINHALFDAAVRNQQFDETFLKDKLRDALESDEIIDSLSCMDLDKENMLEKLIPSIQLISTWGNKFCVGNGAVVSYGQQGDEMTKVNKILDIEENIWSPKYGCKGKVDATVRIHAKSKSKISPIEVKSGGSRNSLGSIDHRAQVILYTMMLEERYKDNVDSGLLYYIKGQQTIGVPSSVVERRALIIKRNEIAGSLHDILFKEKVRLPDLVSDRMSCKYCSHQLSCSLTYKSFEGMDSDFHPYPEMLENNVSSLTQTHLDYFKKFSQLCIQEAQSSKKSSKMPWDSDCKRYCKLSLKNVSSNHGYYHNFSFKTPVNPRNSFLRLGDYVIISKEDGSAYNVVAGFITSLSEQEFDIFVRDVNLKDSPHHREGPCYCVTPHSSLSSLHTSLGNLTSFMSPGERTSKWRKCVVDGGAPQFNNTLFSYTQEASISKQYSSDELLMTLNEDQKSAVKRAVSTEDYLCILGMPGTGKTTTIACLIQLLVGRGHSVLLTAYTHSAVDNLVMKLPASLDLVRLGAPGRIHDANKSRSSQVLTSHIRDPKIMREFYDSKAVVATTCLGLKHSVFEYKKFDYCIIDEASQITQPICLGPVLLSDRCILVGDHHQLPPLVQNISARDRGLGTSLFARLCELHPDTAVCELGIQYRMCSDVMLFSNTLVYNNKLRCASEGVALSALAVKRVDENSLKFVKRCLSPASKVVFLDTSSLGERSFECSTSTSISNPLECKIVNILCKQLLEAGVKEKDIGVMTPYNGQIDLLGEQLPQDIELLTADRYQGRDKPCIILSFTRSNKDRKVGNLLADINRLNVALTRAKSKLIMIGNTDTLGADDLLGSMIDIAQKKSWIYLMNETEYNLLH